MTDIEKIIQLEELIDQEHIESYSSLCYHLRHNFPQSVNFNWQDMHAVVVRYSAHFRALFEAEFLEDYKIHKFHDSDCY